MTTPGRTYSGMSTGERREERRAQLITAALHVAETDGIGGLTVRKVSASAGLSPRYLYESFADLDDLLGQTFDSAARDVAAAVLVALSTAPTDARATVTAVVEALARFVVEQPYKARLLLTDSFGNQTLARRRAHMTDRFAAAFVDHVRTYLDPTSRRGPAVELAARFLVGATAETFTAWVQGSLAYSRKRMVRDTVELSLAVVHGLNGLGRPR